MIVWGGQRKSIKVYFSNIWRQHKQSPIAPAQPPEEVACSVAMLGRVAHSSLQRTGSSYLWLLKEVVSN